MFRSLGASMAAACVAVLASGAAGQLNIPAGFDAWSTTTPTVIIFGGETPPIPAGFFDPGSQPFNGSVQLIGVPIDPAASPADTVVQRLNSGTAFFPNPPAMIPIQLVALHLMSVNPITVNSTQGPSQWNVSVGLDPGPPSTGGSTINVNPTLNGGTFSSQIQIRPIITFTHISGSPTLTAPFTPGLIWSVNSTSSQWSTTQAGVHYPNGGPNFFPTTAQGWATGGGSFMHQRNPAQGADCNGNGIVDSQDLLNGTSLDSNFNRIPDECEAQSSLEQISWLNQAGGFAQRFSAFGRLNVSVVEPPEGVIVWLNAKVGPNWVIQNCPIHTLTGQGVLAQRSIEFNLRNTPGVQVFSLPLIVSLTTAPSSTAPTGTATVKPVTERPASRGMEFDVLNLPIPFDTWFPTIPLDFVNPAINITWTTVERHGVMGVNEMVNGCAPGAGARSLDWMNHLYCLMFPPDCDTAQKIYDKLRDAMHMKTTGSGTDTPNVKAGIDQLIMDKMLQNVLESKVIDNPTGDDIINALQGGNDVMGKVCLTDGVKTWYHRFCIVGGTKCGTSITIDIRDSDQDGTTDTASHPGTVTGAAGAVKISGFGNDATLVSMVVICPKRMVQLNALTKWLFGDTGSGGTTEGLQSLLDRIHNGYMPTAADKANLKLWACNALDCICYLRKNLDKNGTPAARAAADRLKTKFLLLKSDIITYVATMSATYLELARGRLSDPATAMDMAAVKRVVDCNMNGIDDTTDIASGLLHDANHDGVADECECLADWNNSGTVTTQDLFDFLAAWFAHNADFNHSGTTTTQDLFAFLAAWFAKCPGF